MPQNVKLVVMLSTWTNTISKSIAMLWSLNATHEYYNNSIWLSNFWLLVCCEFSLWLIGNASYWIIRYLLNAFQKIILFDSIIIYQNMKQVVDKDVHSGQLSYFSYLISSKRQFRSLWLKLIVNEKINVNYKVCSDIYVIGSFSEKTIPV